MRLSSQLPPASELARAPASELAESRALDAASNPGHLAVAEGGWLLDHYETEQLCEKLSLEQLQALRSRLEDNQGFRAAQQGILQVRQHMNSTNSYGERRHKPLRRSSLQSPGRAGFALLLAQPSCSSVARQVA